MIQRLALAGMLLLALPASSPAGQEEPRTVQVRVDRRIELLAAVQVLSDYGERTRLITRHDFQYRREFQDSFAPFREHRAVALFARMSRRGFSFDAPVAAILCYSDPPELEPQAPVPDLVLRRAGGQEALDEFIESLRDFAVQSDFTAFFEDHEAYYERVTSGVRAVVKDVDDISLLEVYYGTRQHSYTIILAQLFHPGGFGPRVERADGSYDCYSVLGPVGVEGIWPRFGSKEAFRHIVWHEFGHSFANPLIDGARQEVARFEPLFEALRPAMERQAYKNWHTCVCEHLVRAVTTRLADRELGAAAGAAALADERRRGFVYVEPLCRKLEEYERQRERYASLADFLPELLAVFADALGEDEAGHDPANDRDDAGADRPGAR